MDFTQPLTRREFGFMAAIGSASLCSWHASTTNRGGVSLAGAEFGCDKPNFSNKNPGVYGRDYIYPEPATIEYFAKTGLKLLRLPFRWERLQQNPGEPLNGAELKRIKGVVDRASDCGASVVLDLHNYGRYKLLVSGKPRAVVIDEVVDGAVPVSREHFADCWRRIANSFAGNHAVVGYGLMNEPHDMGTSDWKLISQTATDAIRTIDSGTAVVVGGNGWSNARRFPEVNGHRAWINDPAGRVWYEAHCYFDADGSGKYSESYDAELRNDPELLERGAKRLSVFVDWCRGNGVNGFLGEFGVPGGDQRWQAVLANALKTLDKTAIPACYWAAGEWWSDYPLSLQPRDDMTVPAPQLAVLKQWIAQ